MIKVVVGSMATLRVQGLVRPVRSDMAPVDAGSRNLAAAAGPELDQRLERIGALPVGGAMLTPAGQLSAGYIIHIAVMSEDEPQTSLSIQRALRNGLRRAADWGLESIAVPALGLGAGIIDPEVPARALVDILYNHLDEGVPPLDLTIVVGSDYEAVLFTRLIEEAARMRSPERA